MAEVTPDRIIEKLDRLFAAEDYCGAEKLLLYWYDEFSASGNDRLALTIANEYMGLERKLSKREDALLWASRALSLCERLGLSGEVVGGTTALNAATVYKAFGESGHALRYYESACAVYERRLPCDDARFGGLYNNMGLLLVDLKRYDEADELYEKAKRVMALQENGQPERAITLLNQADLETARLGPEGAEAKVSRYLDEAQRLLDTPGLPHDGNYAYVCEKCAPVFGYYGRFVYEEELCRRARLIHERN